MAFGSSGDKTGIGVGDSVTGISVGAGVLETDSKVDGPFPLVVLVPFPLLETSPFPLLSPEEVDNPGFLFGGSFLPPDGLMNFGTSSLSVGSFVGFVVSVSYWS